MSRSPLSRSRRLSLYWLFALAALPGGMSAIAHHTGAMFDLKKSITLSGTVKEFQWTNPHCWIQLWVPTPERQVEWSIEMGAPVDLFRNGWKPGTLKPGDEITVVIHPMRDGSNGGLFVSATASDGSPLSKHP
jgi:hypothetical protein